MIALKATHTAVRVAREVLYDPVDVELLTCPECGTAVDWKNAQVPWYCYERPCQACGAVVTLPCHLRGHTKPTPIEEPVAYRPSSFLSRFLAMPDYRAPSWFVLMFLLCVLAIFAAFIRLVPRH